MFVVVEKRYPYKKPEELMSCGAVFGPFETVEEAREWRKDLHCQARPEDGQIFTAWNVYRVTDPKLWPPDYNDIVDHSGEGGSAGGVDKVALRKRVGGIKIGPEGKFEPAVMPDPGSTVES